MIYGIGTDIVRIARMESNIERFGDRFAERILTAGELQEYRRTQQRARFLAKRFAAKEAAAKAFGTGFSNGLGLRDIGVGHDALGRPLLNWSGRGEEIARAAGISASHLSIADENDYAIAFVTLERAGA